MGVEPKDAFEALIGYIRNVVDVDTGTDALEAIKRLKSVINDFENVGMRKALEEENWQAIKAYILLRAVANI